MTASSSRYSPNQYSEKLLTSPYKGCGISTACHGDDMASLGEFTVLPTGRLKSVAQRRRDLQRGWRAFKRVPDDNGIPDTDDYLRISLALAPGLPLPTQLWTRNWDDVMDHIKSGEAISIALRLSALGSSNKVDLTTADHQVLFWGEEKGGETNVMGPMRAQRESYHGHKAPLAQIREASKAISGGQILTWLYPIGGWTQEALALEEVATKVTRKQRVIVALRGMVDDLKGQQPPPSDEDALALRKRIEYLEAVIVDTAESLQGSLSE